MTEQQCSTQQQWKQSVRTLANLQGIAVGRKDVQYLLCIPGDVLEWRPGLQRGRRSKILALNGRIIMCLSQTCGPPHSFRFQSIFATAYL